MTPAAASKLPYRPCAGIMLLNQSDRIFVGERLDKPGAWQMPQGGIDDGETPEQAAFRELEEEIGLPATGVDLITMSETWVYYDLPAELIGKVWKGRYCGQKQRWALMRLKTSDSNININTAHPEFGAWKWTERDALVSEIVPFKRDVYQQVINDLLD